MIEHPEGQLRLHVENEYPPFWDSLPSPTATTLFHQSAWADVLREGYGLQPLFCWLEMDGEPLIGTLGAILDMKLVRIFHSCIPFGGLVGDETFTGDFITLLEPALKQLRVHTMRIAEPRHFPMLERCGFHGEEVARHIVDLKGHDAESLFNALPRMVRKAIRKSRKEDLVIRELKDRSEIVDVFDLYVRTMSLNRAAAKHPIGRFLAIYDHLVPIGKGIILVATFDGRIVGSNTLVCSDDMVHDIQLSYDHEFQNKRPNDALVYASLLWTIEKGKTKFDFMGSPAEDDSLEKFKAKWLAERTTTITYGKDLGTVRSMAWRLIQRTMANPVGAWLIRKIRTHQGSIRES